MTLVIYGGIMELCEPKWIHAIKSGVWGVGRKKHSELNRMNKDQKHPKSSW